MPNVFKLISLVLLFAACASANISSFPGSGGGGGGSGTVTSVGLADGSSTPIFTISGSPVTTAGTLTETLANEAVHACLIGPTSGSPAQPTFRALVAADLPTGDLISSPTTNLTVTNGTGAVVGSGTTLVLTGASLVESTSSVLTLSGATNAVLGTGTTIQVKQAGTSQSGYLSSTDWNTFNGKGSGTVSGPGTTVVNNIMSWNSTVGTVAKDSGISIKTGGGTTTDTSFYIGPGAGPTNAGTDNVILGPTGGGAVSGNNNTLAGNGCNSGTGSNNVCFGSAQIFNNASNATALGNGAYAYNFSLSAGAGANNTNGSGTDAVNLGHSAGNHNGNDFVVNTGTLAGNFSGSLSSSYGYHSGLQATGGAANSNTFGAFAGAYDTANGSFYVDAFDRTNTAGGKTGAILYGVMSATASAQTLTTNSAFTAAQSVTSPILSSTATQTTVGCSTSGTVIFSQPEQGSSHKIVVIYASACLGTASYTFPTAFTNTPQVLSQSLAAVATSLSASAVTITGTTTTGFLNLDGY